MKISEAVEMYIKLRDTKSEITNEYKEKLAPVEAKMEKLEAAISGAFDSQGVDSFKTEMGTAYRGTRTTVTAADKDVFLAHIRETENFELLEMRPAKAAVQAYIDEHGDAPPGVNLRVERTVGVRRA